jgi:O-antigen ligase
MGIFVKFPRSVAVNLLLLLPIVVLIVPQGTIERSLVPEAIFAALLLLATTTVVAEAALRGQLLVFSRQFNHPIFFLMLFFLSLNSIWSLWQGNDPAKVVMTVLPFTMLGTYLLLVASRLDGTDQSRLLQMFGLSGVLLAVAVIVNYLVGDLSAFAMRSTGIEGQRTFTLPILPVSGVLLTAWALSASSRKQAYLSAAASMMVVTAIFLTVTRAMLLAYLLGSILGVVYMYRYGDQKLRRQIVLRGSAGLAIVGFLTLPVLAQWAERVNPESTGDVATILGRLDEYAAFLEAFLESPIVGKGVGYVATYPSDFDHTLRETGITVCHSHLFFFAGTTGILGLILYYGFLTIGLRDLWRQAKHLRNDADAIGEVAGLAGAVVAGIVFTLTSTTFTTLSYNLFLAIFLYRARSGWRKA